MPQAPFDVREAKTKAEIKAFVELPWTIYRNDPNWVPPLLSMAYEIIDTDKHPFWQHARRALFNAWRGDELVGRIAAIVNPNHNQIHDDKVGFFGFFESINEQAVADALFDAAGDWLRAQGLTDIRGPANPSVNDEYGLLVDGFDSPPVIMMTYNLAYYIDLIEGAGFEKAMDLWAYWQKASAYGVGKADNLPSKLERIANVVRKRGKFSVRKVNMQDWDNEVERLKKVYNAAWQKNWGAVFMTDAEIEHLAEGLKQSLDPNLIFIVEKQGEAVGISITVPDLNQALIKAYPRPGVPEIWTLLKLLWYWKVRGCVKGCRVMILGVLEEYRARGVNALLLYETAASAVENNYDWGEMSWILETNTMIQRDIETMGGRVYKTYRLYQKSL